MDQDITSNLIVDEDEPDRQAMSNIQQSNDRQSTPHCKGVVAVVHQDGRYGFIAPKDGTKKAFVHRNSLGMKRHCLQVGAADEYTVEFDPRLIKYNAVDVTLLDNPARDATGSTPSRRTGTIVDIHSGCG